MWGNEGGNKLDRFASPWIVVGAAAILAAVVAILASRHINRGERYMGRILSEKGAALINAVEAGARTGMVHGDQLQRLQSLLELIGTDPGTLFIYIVDKDGTVVTGVPESALGSRFPSRPFDYEDIPGNKVRSTIMDEQGVKAFLVYKRFEAPASSSTFSSSMGTMVEGMPMAGSTLQTVLQGSSIYIGLDLEPFEALRMEDRHNTMVIAGILALLSLSGIISLFWAQHSRRAKRRMRESQVFASEVVANLPVGLVVIDAEGFLTTINAAAEDILDMPPLAGEMLGAGALPSPLPEISARAAAGKAVLEEESEIVFPDGTSAPVSISAVRVRSENNDLIGDILVVRDLSEVRILQEEVRKQEKLAAMGNLAAGVAHEIRNPLSSIKASATYFGVHFEEGSDGRRMSEVMVREVDRLNRVITQLLDLSRPSDIQPLPTDVNQLVERSLDLVRQDAKAKGVDVQFTPNPALHPITLDRDRMIQALLNIHINALQVMPDGGKLAAEIFESDGEARIAIRDTGSGMPPEQLSKIFNPYFTTRASGTGLGLAIAQKILEAHGGRISAESKPGKGSVFTLSIPIAAPKQEGHHEAENLDR